MTKVLSLFALGILVVIVGAAAWPQAKQAASPVCQKKPQRKPKTAVRLYEALLEHAGKKCMYVEQKVSGSCWLHIGKAAENHPFAYTIYKLDMVGEDFVRLFHAKTKVYVYIPLREVKGIKAQ